MASVYLGAGAIPVNSNFPRDLQSLVKLLSPSKTYKQIDEKSGEMQSNIEMNDL